jgi:large subunit ribosomal protein L23
MGILGFGKKEKVTEKKVTKTSKKEVAVVASKNNHASLPSVDYVLRPLITEKAHSQSETNNVFTFKISEEANKTEVAKYIKSKYKVEPVKIAIVNVKGKKVFSRGKVGFKPGSRKAYVYLKKGDKIEIA